MRISDWSSDVCSSDRHTSSPDSTVAEGSIHCRCALAGTTASVAAAIVAVKPRIIFFMPCPFEKSAEGDRNGAEFGLARGASAGAGLGRPGEGNAEQFAATHLARRLDHQHIGAGRSEEHTSELQSLMRISYAVFC